MALALTHHLTPLITIAILSGIAIGHFVGNMKKGLPFYKSDFLLVAVLTAVTTLYYLFYGQAGFKPSLTPIDWLSAASYQAVLFPLTLWLALKHQTQSKARTAFMCSTFSVTVFAFTWLATRKPLVPGAPVLPANYILYAGPFIAAAPLCVLGYGMMRKMCSEEHVMPLFWLAAVLGLEGYAIFGNAGPGLGLTLAYRVVNFILPPLAILLALGVHRLYEHEGSRKAFKVGAAALTLFILSTNVYSFYAAVNLQERYMGYFWLYRIPEYCAAAWVKGLAGNMTVAGDVKTFYLLKYYFNVNVDVFQGLKYLTGNARKPQILFVYDQMFKNGYVVYGGYSVDLPENWTGKASNLNLVYSNNLSNVYVK